VHRLEGDPVEFWVALPDVDDVEALLGVLGEVVHLQAPGGEDPAAVGEPPRRAAPVVVAGEDEGGVSGGKLVEGEVALIGGDPVVPLDEGVEHQDLQALRFFQGRHREPVEGGVRPVVVVEADDRDVPVLVGDLFVVEDVEVPGEGVLDVVECVGLGSAVVVATDD